MATVYRASTDRRPHVAIKVLSPDLVESAHHVSRFLQEARIMNHVRHVNVVQLFEFVEEAMPRRLAFVMELVEGVALHDLIGARTLSLRQTAEVGRQLADALRAVHDAGVVHRDLKPENIIVGGAVADGDAPLTAKLVDFGVAKVPGMSVNHRTAPGCAVGTPSYMAPEQMAAENVTPATDVYALGEILFEMHTGRRAFAAGDRSIVRRKLLGEIPDLSGLDRRFADIVRRCLSASPDDRPTIAQLDRGLARLSRPDTPWWKRRRAG